MATKSYFTKKLKQQLTTKGAPAIAINTDYAKDTGSPESYLKRISEAGFTHIMWAHHWGDDFLYSEAEITQILKWLRTYNLQILHIHGSCGEEKNWISLQEYRRLAGIELMKNRISMASQLSCNTVVMHLGDEYEPTDKILKKQYWEALHKTLDEIKPFAKQHKVRIALENPSDSHVNCKEIKLLLSQYGSDFLGFCYDTGHGNLGGDFELFESLKDRLIAVHLNDNNGHISEHGQLFSGSVNWNKIAELIAKSAYDECMCMEVSTKQLGEKEESIFLRNAYKLGLKFSNMVNKIRIQ